MDYFFGFLKLTISNKYKPVESNKHMNNQAIAAIFYEMADILEIMDVRWKPIAFRNAARAIEALSEDVADIYKDKGIIGIREISSVGQSIALKIIEYVKTGKIKEYQALKKKVPSGLMKMMHIPTLGPKRVKVLFKELGVKTIPQLEKAAKQGKIRKLEGFGEKSEQEILAGIGLFKQSGARMLVGYALPIAEELVERIRALKEVKRAEIAGSIRRMKEDIGDIDILVTSDKAEGIMNFFTTMPDVKKILVKGPTKSSVILLNGMQCDLRVIDDDRFGAAMQYFTGNVVHNVETRKIAIKKGYKLSEYGLFSRKTNRVVAARSEEEVYKKIGMQYIPPEIRTNTGEIEAAIKNKIPKLVELRDIKGDFQMHTKWTDGSNTILEMVKEAKSLGYEYIAITDHSKRTTVANGMKEDRLGGYIKAIRSADKKVRGIKVLASSEVDILADGDLDYPDKILKKFDVVLAAIHSGFKQPKSRMMRRIEKGLSNKYVNMFAHPTGRILHRREPYAVDIEHLCQIAKDTKTALEVNASISRLDLKGAHVRKALESGVKLSMGTDAHSTEQLHLMRFGVGQARAGWATKKDIINTKTWNQLKKYWNL